MLSYVTRHRTLANLLLVIMLVSGIWAFPQMRAQFFPDTIVESISITYTWDGAGAEDVDRAIAQIAEPAMRGVDGAIASESTSREGRVTISADFEPGWDMAQAQEDVQAALDTIASQLPDEVEDPEPRRGRWFDTVTDVVITGPVAVEQLARYADEFVLRLQAEGVTSTSIRGIAAPSTLIEVPSLSLIKNDVTMAQIAEAIARETRADPAGDVAGASRVRTGEARRDATAIAAIALRTNPDGSNLTVGDVGRVIVEGVDRDRAYFVGEKSAIAINVQRSATGDAIEIQGIVQEAADKFVAELPQGTTVDLIRTRAEAISGRLNILLENAIVGLALVVGLLFLFLNARTAFWVALGIPVALSAAIFLMWFSGLSINMISLFALIITLGIVVDDAIVVGEHADFRARILKEPPVEAAENAAKRMFTPVFSATITTVIAFFGLTVVEGRFGNLIADIPFTVIVVLIASLIECFLILPNHMAHSVGAKQRWYDVPSMIVNWGFNWVKEKLFRPFMRLVIWARYPVFAGVIVVLISQITLFMSGEVQWRFFNAPERSSVSGNFAMAPGATREDSLNQMQQMQAAVERLGKDYEERHGANPVKYAIAEIGGNSGRPLAGSDTKESFQLGAISIELIDADLRPYSSFAFVAELQDAVPRHPLVETISFRGWRSGPGGDALDVQFFGADSRTLKNAAEDLKTALLQFPEVSAVEDSLAYDKEELILALTPQGQALGLTTDGLGRVLRNRVNGVEAATFPDGGRTATIRVELPAGELTADFLSTLMVRTASGGYVPLSDIVTVEARNGFSTVRRENGVQVISVTGDISEDDADRATEIQAALESDILPLIAGDNQVQWRLAGLAEQENAFLNDAMLGLMLVLGGIYLTLTWIFASWTRPIVVMAIIPFGLVGTIFGHWVHGVPLSMFSVVGIIGMVGIVINDSIVLVTTIDEKARDRGIVPAIIDGACDRLRPVLLTTLTTVLGLMPLLFESSNQAQFLKPTIITLVYGLGFGMILVLLVVPSLMAMQMDVGQLMRAARRGMASVGRRGPGLVMVLTAALMAAAFAGTIGSYFQNGDMFGPLTAVPVPGIMGAVATFIALCAAVAFAMWVLAGAAFGLRRLRS